MSVFTVEELAEMLREGAGEAEPIDWTRATLDRRFEDLGYDSIALLETASRVRQRYGVIIEDELAELETPAAFIHHVNSLVTTG